MSESNKGKLILEKISEGSDVEKIVVYLSGYFKKIPREKFTVILKKTPVILAKNITIKKAKSIIANLKILGAESTFIPEDIIEDLNRISHESDSIEIPFDDLITTQTPLDKSALGPFESTIKKAGWDTVLIQKFMEVNKELWLILSMFLILGLMNIMITPSQMILSFYILPTIFAAYFFGKHHAVMTAFASIFLVCFVIYFMPNLFRNENKYTLLESQWFNLTIWAGILVITAYTMGNLYERNKAKLIELQSTYQGILVILRHFISKDKYTENHCYRVSIYAAKIAAYLGLSKEKIEDIRAAALLHDLGKLDISRELLYKAAKLNKEEFEQIKHHPELGADILDSIKGPLGRIIPIILSHHDKFDGTGYHEIKGERIPLEARIISVADVYDALASDRPYRKAMSPHEVKEQIEKGSGAEFDPIVVTAFLQAFNRGDMEVSSVML